MLGEVAIAGIITGIIRTHKIDRWARLILSCSASAICTWWGTFGMAGLAHLASGQGFTVAAGYATFEASLSTAAIVWFVWRRSDLTKGMMIAAPAFVEQREREILEHETIASVEK
jgi:hypothetical protein